MRLFTFCVLYCAQGIPWGFLAITLPAYLAGRGAGAAEIGGALAMTTLPYTFKWAWGPIIDAFTIARFGRRRPWILLAQGMMALTIGAMIAIPDLVADVELLTWMIFVHTVFNSMQDVAVDALAVDLLDEAERGRTNGLMYGSKYAGGVIGGAGMSGVIAWAGLRPALVVQAVLLVAIMMVPLRVRERAGAPGPRPSIGSLLGSLWRALCLRSAVLCGVVMVTATIATGLLAAIAAILFTRKLGWRDTEYAAIAGGPALVFGLGGSVLGGFLADKVGHRRLAALGSAGLVVLWLGFAAAEAWWTHRAFVYALLAVEPLCVSVMTVSLFALCMDVSSPRIAATQFTVYMSLANVSTTIGARLAGHAAAWWELRGIYVAAAAIQLGVTGVMALVDPRETREALAAGPPA